MSNIDDNNINKQNIDELNQASELAMETAGRKRHKKNQERMEPSARKGQHTFKEEILQTVLDELDVILKDTVNRKGGPAPAWLNTFTKQDKETGEIVWKYNMYAMADAAISEAVDGHYKDWSEQYTQEQIGKAIYGLLFEFVVRNRRAGHQLLEKVLDKEFEKLDKQLIMSSGNHETRREILFRKMEKWGFKIEWSQGDYIHHARPFYLALQATGKFDIDYRPVEGKLRKGGHQVWANFLVLSEEVLDQIEKDNNYIGDIRTAFAPMWKKPLPWNINSIGPYRIERIAARVPMVRDASPDQKVYLEAARKTGDMDGLLHALNVLQEVPYRINSYVLEAVQWIDNNNVGNGPGKLKQREKSGKLKKFPVLVKPPVMKDLSAEEKAVLSPHELRNHYRKFFATRKLRTQVERNQGTVNKYLKQAERLQKVDAPFYLPHNMDFRGRVYCVPDFNPQQVDYIRAMFYFDNKKQISSNPYGEAYLKLQLANTYGLTKEGYATREAWVEENEADIIQVGTSFRNTFDFWSKAKEPMQFLAACREWYLYKQDPDNFESGLPIGQDATQSGIQIFAAAALDAEDGEKVNLRCFDENGKTPERPFDMYAVCLEKAKKLVEESLVENEAKLAENPITEEEEAQWVAHENFMLDPDVPKEDKVLELERWKTDPTAAGPYKFKIRKNIEAAKAVKNLGKAYDRNVIKRQVMTLGYSATLFGFASQIREDWIDGYTDEVIRQVRAEHPFGEDYGFAASNFLAGIHMKAIKDTLSSVESGMDYIVHVASVLAANNQQVQFVSRMGFPNFQNYRLTTSATQKLMGRDNITNIYKTCAERDYRKPTKGINRRKVNSGSAPNLVHNTDATLLMQTMLNCSDDRGVNNLMVIHDSFSTTAADARDLYQAVREEFIMLFDQYDLYADFRKQAINLLMQEGETVADFLRLSEEEFQEQCINNGVKFTKSGYQAHCRRSFALPPEKVGTLDLNEVWHSPYFFN